MAVLLAKRAAEAAPADPRGPVEYPGMKAVSPERGAQNL
jgi:hypothetical protein